MSGEDRRELLADSDKLFTYLSSRLEQMQRVLSEEADFCDKDVDSSLKFIEAMEKKFQKKIQEFKKQLDDIRTNNNALSETRLKALAEASENIDKSYTEARYEEALKLLDAQQQSFQQRTPLTGNIPNLRTKEREIDRILSSEQQPSAAAAPAPRSAAALAEQWAADDDEGVHWKSKIRAKKTIDKDTVNDDDDKSVANGANDQPREESLFGSRSQRSERQLPPPPTTVSAITTSTNPLPAPLSSPASIRSFSTRLPRKPALSNPPPPIPPPAPLSEASAENGHEPSRPTRKPSPKPLSMTPVVLYSLEPNHHLLVASAVNEIVLFKCPRNRLDRWHLATTQRGTGNTGKLPWHGGLLISMGFTNDRLLYMFTEREFVVYALPDFKKVAARILPRGNDNDCDVSALAYPASQRGIGTVHDKHMYHIYLNRSSHWTLSANRLEAVVHLHDQDLTQLFPEVDRFIHLCVNEKFISFLVQMLDLTYAVVFCAVRDYSRRDYPNLVPLTNANQPLTICSTNQSQFYINDPSIDVVHVIDMTGYLHYHPVKAHAICQVIGRSELLMVTDNSICTIDIN